MGDINASIKGDSVGLVGREELVNGDAFTVGNELSEGATLAAAFRIEPSVAPDVCVEVVILLPGREVLATTLVAAPEKLSNETEEEGVFCVMRFAFCDDCINTMGKGLLATLEEANVRIRVGFAETAVPMC